MSTLSASEFCGPLQKAGLLPANTRRVIIDVEAGQVVKIYYDTFASQTLLQVITPEFLMNAVKVEHAGEAR